MNFSDFIFNKKVLLLGPAPHVLEKSSIEDWREFDLVIKINKMVENVSFYDEDLNFRNDVLYHCLDVNPKLGDKQYSVDEWVKKNVKLLRISPPPITPYYRKNIERFLETNENRIPFSTVDEGSYLELVSECQNTIPNTGTFAIFDLLRHKPRQLHIRGITFFKGGYLESYKDLLLTEKEIIESYKTSTHDIDKQKKFFKKLYEDNQRIIYPDRELLNVIRRS
jgi:hypothetical protein